LPEYSGDECIACEQCVAICPGLAITLVDYSDGRDYATVTVPHEFPPDTIGKGDTVTVLDTEGKVLGNVEVVRVRQPRFADRAVLLRLKAPRAIAKRIAGIRVQDPWVSEPLEETVERIPDDEIICRCERVTAGEIRELIRSGVRDMNYIKAVTRAGMGACGSKTCTNLIKRLFQQEGIQPGVVRENTQRPLFIEVPLGVFAGVSDRERPAEEVPVTHATDAHEGGM
jgi:ferredoxin